MDDLNQSTNRLRRKFDSTSNYLETKVQMEQVMDSAREVNQVVGKGGNDGRAQSLWKALRASINDLARAYNLTPSAHREGQTVPVDRGREYSPSHGAESVRARTSTVFS